MGTKQIRGLCFRRFQPLNDCSQTAGLCDLCHKPKVKVRHAARPRCSRRLCNRMVTQGTDRLASRKGPTIGKCRSSTMAPLGRGGPSQWLSSAIDLGPAGAGRGKVIGTKVAAASRGATTASMRGRRVSSEESRRSAEPFRWYQLLVRSRDSGELTHPIEWISYGDTLNMTKAHMADGTKDHRV